MKSMRLRASYAITGVAAGAVLMTSLPVSADLNSAAREPKDCKGVKATIVNGAGDDVILGTPGRDIIVGGEGNDRIRGLGGNDRLCGEQGNDKVLGGTGRDHVFGQEANDALAAGKNPGDVCGGGAGTDSVIPGKKCRRTKGVENK